MKFLPKERKSLASFVSQNYLGIKNPQIREAFGPFNASEHKMEPVIKMNGISYINSSKSTSINATWYDLNSKDLEKGSEIIWIAGGVAIRQDYSTLQDLVKDKVKYLILLGKENNALESSFESLANKTYCAKSMQDAVVKARSLAKKGDTILLSPTSASFDLFENYEDRGNQFKKYVAQLA